jgi:hypothetical protein
MKPKPLPLYAYECGYTLRGIVGSKHVHVIDQDGKKHVVNGLELCHENIFRIIAETKR